MAIKVQFRRGLASEWVSSNPVLDEGELGLETDTGLFKIGNGSDTYTSLDYGGLSGPTGPTGATGAGGGILYNAIATLDVSNNGSGAYQFNSHYSGDNPTVYALGGATLAFDLTNVSSSHPFLIEEDSGSGFANITTGIIHAGDDGTISTGSSAQGKTSGTVYWQVPTTSISDWRYRCSVHSSMVGTLDIKSLPDLVEIYDSVFAPLYFVENLQTANYTLALSDAAKVVAFDSSNNLLLFLPSNSSVPFPIGTVINVYRAGSGDVLIESLGPTIRNSTTSAPYTISSQYGEVSLRKRGTDEWVLVGDLIFFGAP